MDNYTLFQNDERVLDVLAQNKSEAKKQLIELCHVFNNYTDYDQIVEIDGYFSVTLGDRIKVTLTLVKQ